MDPANEKKLLIIIVSVTLVLALAFGFFIYRGHNTLTTLRDEGDTAKSTADKLDADKISKMKTAQKDLEVARNKYKEEYVHQLPDDGSPEAEAAYQSLLDDLERFSKQTNIQVVDYVHENTEKKASAKKKGKTKDYIVYRWEYTLRANFEQAVLFINEVENHRRVLAINSFTIDNDRPAEDGRYAITLEFLSYTFRRADAAAKK